MDAETYKVVDTCSECLFAELDNLGYWVCSQNKEDPRIVHQNGHCSKWEKWQNTK